MSRPPYVPQLSTSRWSCARSVARWRQQSTEARELSRNHTAPIGTAELRSTLREESRRQARVSVTSWPCEPCSDATMGTTTTTSRHPLSGSPSRPQRSRPTSRQVLPARSMNQVRRWRRGGSTRRRVASLLGLRAPHASTRRPDACLSLNLYDLVWLSRVGSGEPQLPHPCSRWLIRLTRRSSG